MADLTQVVHDAVTLLAPLIPFLSKAGEAVAEKVGEAAYEKIKALYATIRDKFTLDKDEYALQTLQRLEEKPTDDGRKKALESIITDKVQVDAGFAEKLERSVAEAKQDQVLTQFITNVYGNAQVGKIFNIGQVGHMTIDS